MRCTRCGLPKTPEDFYARQRRCRTCCNELRAEAKRLKRQRRTVTPRLYVDATPVAEAIRASSIPVQMIADRMGVNTAIVYAMLSAKRISARRASAVLDAIGVLPAEIGL